MPLSDPTAREHIHTRSIECRGFQRADGLWDIEAHMTDTKTYAIANDWRGELAPGVPLHDMWVRLTVDDALEVQAVEVTSDATPFRMCADIAPAFQALKGLRIRPGWNKMVRSRLGGVRGCTHLVELLGPIATVAFQTMYPKLRRERDKRPERPPPQLDTCHAWASDSEVVARYYPQWHGGKKD